MKSISSLKEYSDKLKEIRLNFLCKTFIDQSSQFSEEVHLLTTSRLPVDKLLSSKKPHKISFLKLIYNIKFSSRAVDRSTTTRTQLPINEELLPPFNQRQCMLLLIRSELMYHGTRCHSKRPRDRANISGQRSSFFSANNTKAIGTVYHQL